MVQNSKRLGLQGLCEGDRMNEAMELFEEERHFTNEEAKLYEESLLKLFVSTGENF